MQHDGQLRGGLELFDQRIGVIGQQQTRHILDADQVRAHAFDILREFYEVFLRMNAGHGVAHRDLGCPAVFFRRLDGGLHVAQVVQRVEGTDDVDAVVDGFLDKIIHNVICVMLIA